MSARGPPSLAARRPAGRPARSGKRARTGRRAPRASVDRDVPLAARQRPGGAPARRRAAPRAGRWPGSWASSRSRSGPAGPAVAPGPLHRRRPRGRRHLPPHRPGPRLRGRRACAAPARPRRRLVSARVSWRAGNRLRERLAAHALRLEPAWHGRHSPGELIERIDGDVEAMTTFFADIAVRIAGNVALIAGMLVLATTIDPWAGLVLTVTALAGAATMVRLRVAAVDAREAEREVNAQLYGDLEERLGGLEDLRANGAGRYAVHRLLAHSARSWRAARRASLRGDGAWRRRRLRRGDRRHHRRRRGPPAAGRGHRRRRAEPLPVRRHAAAAARAGGGAAQRAPEGAGRRPAGRRPAGHRAGDPRRARRRRWPPGGSAGRRARPRHLRLPRRRRPGGAGRRPAPGAGRPPGPGRPHGRRQVDDRPARDPGLGPRRHPARPGGGPPGRRRRPRPHPRRRPPAGGGGDPGRRAVPGVGPRQRDAVRRPAGGRRPAAGRPGAGRPRRLARRAAGRPRHPAGGERRPVRRRGPAAGLRPRLPGRPGGRRARRTLQPARPGDRAPRRAATEALLAGRTAIVIAHRLATLDRMDEIAVLEAARSSTRPAGGPARSPPAATPACAGPGRRRQRSAREWPRDARHAHHRSPTLLDARRPAPGPQRPGRVPDRVGRLGGLLLAPLATAAVVRLVLTASPAATPAACGCSSARWPASRWSGGRWSSPLPCSGTAAGSAGRPCPGQPPALARRGGPGRPPARRPGSGQPLPRRRRGPGPRARRLARHLGRPRVLRAGRGRTRRHRPRGGAGDRRARRPGGARRLAPRAACGPGAAPPGRRPPG